jgi:hypothetical protein
VRKDAFTRQAVAEYLTVVDDGSAPYAELHDLLLADPDWSVRIAAGYTGTIEGGGATVWTCHSCGFENGIAAEQCEKCDKGSRPDVHPSD